MNKKYRNWLIYFLALVTSCPFVALADTTGGGDDTTTTVPPIIINTDTCGLPPVDVPIILEPLPPAEPDTTSNAVGCPDTEVPPAPSGIDTGTFVLAGQEYRFWAPSFAFAGGIITGSLASADCESLGSTAGVDLPNLRIGDVESPTTPANWKVQLRETEPREVHELEFEHSGAEASIPLRVVEPSKPAGERFIAPRLGFAGGEIAIVGEFDGDINTTKAWLNGKPAVAVAETSGYTSLLLPDMEATRARLEVCEQGKKIAAESFYVLSATVTPQAKKWCCWCRRGISVRVASPGEGTPEFLLVVSSATKSRLIRPVDPEVQIAFRLSSKEGYHPRDLDSVVVYPVGFSTLELMVLEGEACE